MARAWTEEESEKLKEMHSSGASLNACARELDRSTETIHRRARELGLFWDSTQVREMVDVLRADGKARRAALVTDLSDDMRKLRQQIWEPATVFNFGGKDNTYEEVEVPEPPVQDKLRLVQAIQAASVTIDRLEKLDADQGVTDAISLLDRIGNAIKQAALQAELEDLL